MYRHVCCCCGESVFCQHRQQTPSYHSERFTPSRSFSMKMIWIRSRFAPSQKKERLSELFNHIFRTHPSFRVIDRLFVARYAVTRRQPQSILSLRSIHMHRQYGQKWRQVNRPICRYQTSVDSCANNCMQTIPFLISAMNLLFNYAGDTNLLVPKKYWLSNRPIRRILA